MAKRLEITADIAAKLKAATQDPNLDVSNLAVFETIIADTNPLSQRGSITGMQDAAERALTRFRAFATLTVSEPPIVFLAARFHSPVAQW